MCNKSGLCQGLVVRVENTHDRHQGRDEEQEHPEQKIVLDIQVQ